MGMSGVRASSSTRGSDASSPWVYGMRALWKTSSTGPSSTSLPAYITPMRSEMYFTTARLWAMKTYDSPSCCCRSLSRLST